MRIVSISVYALMMFKLFIVFVAVLAVIIVWWSSSKKKTVTEETAAVQKTLGETLKTYRIGCNMTQEYVAEALDVSRQAVSKWEVGSSDPSTSNLLALAKLFDVPVEELLRNVK